MRSCRLLPLFALSAMLLAGCAARIEKAEAAPIAPPDGFALYCGLLSGGQLPTDLRFKAGPLG